MHKWLSPHIGFCKMILVDKFPRYLGFAMLYEDRGILCYWGMRGWFGADQDVFGEIVLKINTEVGVEGMFMVKASWTRDCSVWQFRSRQTCPWWLSKDFWMLWGWSLQAHRIKCIDQRSSRLDVHGSLRCLAWWALAMVSEPFSLCTTTIIAIGCYSAMGLETYWESWPCPVLVLVDQKVRSIEKPIGLAFS